VEMIKRSGGDLGKLESLKIQALEGAFDAHLCRSLDECLFIPNELRHLVKAAIKAFEEEGDTQSFAKIVRRLK